jgi:hypothetical protein
MGMLNDAVGRVNGIVWGRVMLFFISVQVPSLFGFYQVRSMR